MRKITFFHKKSYKDDRHLREHLKIYFFVFSLYDQKNYMHGKNIDGKNLPPELTRSKANMKAIAVCRRKLRGLHNDIARKYGYLMIELTFLKELMLMRQVNQESWIFVTIVFLR